MPELSGANFIGSEQSKSGRSFSAVDPQTRAELPTRFTEATATEVDRALRLAVEAFQIYRKAGSERKAAFLSSIADQLEALGDDLLLRAVQETALDIDRLRGERLRTANQLRMFAELVREGSWVDARIDRAQSERKPLPKPDIRRMLVPMGPVAAFSASNFPLAFSVAGGDTASALAAGCPVVVKAHPGHPGTSELVARAVLLAAERTGMPEGVFSLLQGPSHDVGAALVRHPLTKAVAFTGSLSGGRALYDAAATRPEPIPVFAEMGSTNPVFLLPHALQERGEAIAAGLVQSVTLGAGQFCTNPGLVVGVQGAHLSRFVEQAALHVAERPPATMLYDRVCSDYLKATERLKQIAGVELVGQSRDAADPSKTQAVAALFATDEATFAGHPGLREEVFGPASMVVATESKQALLEFARRLEGHLTATIHGTEEDLEDHRELVDILADKVGRVIFNGFPTGVEVTAAMQHGGPYPATTDSRWTSVGTAAIYRFARPVCYQGFPDSALPPALQDANPLGIWRLVDGERVRE